MEQRQEQYYRTVREYCYSLEHNVPMDSHEGGSTRSAVEDSLYVNITVIMLMGIFMASVIVAGEHTSGAVRLLMIRPVQGGKYCFQSCAACFFALRVG